jgi:hypothetical protein
VGTSTHAGMLGPTTLPCNGTSSGQHISEGTSHTAEIPVLWAPAPTQGCWALPRCRAIARAAGNTSVRGSAIPLGPLHCGQIGMLGPTKLPCNSIACRWGTSHELNCILAAGDSDSDDPEIPFAHTDTDDDIPDLVTESESSDEEILETSQVAAPTHYTRRVLRAPRNLPIIRAATNLSSFAAQQREGTPVDTPGSHSGVVIDDSGGLVSCSENATTRAL